MEIHILNILDKINKINIFFIFKVIIFHYSKLNNFNISFLGKKQKKVYIIFKVIIKKFEI